MLVKPPKILPTKTPVDPLELLPNELFVLIFHFLCQLDIVTASSANSKWRSILLSIPHLYSYIHLKLRDDSCDRLKNVHRHVANLQIKSLIKASKLSQNRIEHLHLDAQCFIMGEQRLIGRNWNWTLLSTLFDVLSFSQDHLETFELDIPESVVAKDDDMFKRVQFMVVKDVLESLKGFRKLRYLEIRASTLLDLTYASEDKKLIIHNNCQDETGSGSIPPEAHKMLLQSIQSFFQGSFTRVGYHSRTTLDTSIVKELASSKSSLEGLNLYFVELERCEKEIIELVTSCPNLTRLDIKFPNGTSEKLDDGKFFVSKDFNHVSKLKNLDISGDIRLPWDRDSRFFEWCGTSLESLHLDLKVRYVHGQAETEEEFLDQTPVNGLLFTTFLRPLSSTLTKIYLRSVVMEQTSTQSSTGDLALETLEDAWIEGNMDLVNFFLKVRYSDKLQEFHATPYFHKPNTIDRDRTRPQIDSLALRGFLRSCSETLKSFALTEREDTLSRYSSTWGDEEQERIQLELTEIVTKSDFSKDPERLTFKSLNHLDLELSLVEIVEFFSYNHYPALEQLFVREYRILKPIFLVNSPNFPEENVERGKKEWEEREEKIRKLLEDFGRGEDGEDSD